MPFLFSKLAVSYRQYGAREYGIFPLYMPAVKLLGGCLSVSVALASYAGFLASRANWTGLIALHLACSATVVNTHIDSEVFDRYVTMTTYLHVLQPVRTLYLGGRRVGGTLSSASFMSLALAMFLSSLFMAEYTFVPHPVTRRTEVGSGTCRWRCVCSA